MYKIYHPLIFIACFWILHVGCQGGGGRGFRGGRAGIVAGGGGGGGGYEGGLSESTKVFVVFVLPVSVVLVLLACICKYYKGTPPMNNTTFTRSNHRVRAAPNGHPNVFRNGMWSSRYYQYGIWNGPFEFMLSFDAQTKRLKGWGSDNIGKFTIIGHYSNETLRIDITKTYINGTGDNRQNLGHDVTIQLTGNGTGKFNGRWYVNTNKYQGDDAFELQYIRDCDYYDDV